MRVDENKLLQLIEEVELILDALKQDGLPPGEYPHLSRDIEAVKLMIGEKADELTLLHFTADIIRCKESEYRYETLWLCTRSDIKAVSVKRAQKLYEAWKAKELEAESARVDIRTNGPYSKI